jgi:hypothetical protein
MLTAVAGFAFGPTLNRGSLSGSTIVVCAIAPIERNKDIASTDFFIIGFFVNKTLNYLVNI